ncbi:MAG: sensor histidine kinase [Gammaproteobacteria bacterium]
MLEGWTILVVSFAYLGLLFGIAYYGDKRADQGRSIIDNPYVYSLSIAVYCTAWTYYGSVGQAASSGINFLPTYLGPTLIAILWWVVLRKIIRIAKQQRVTSIADFVASRYGKSAVLAGLVTIIAVVGIAPYISLQLKAIDTSYFVLSHYPELTMPDRGVESAWWQDTALYVALLLATFSILFGTRHIDATEHHEGMVAAIAFESIVKLLVFLAVGIFVTFGLFDGFGDVFSQAAERVELASLMSLDGVDAGSWLLQTLIAMSAILFLPRQFQVGVVENVREEHVRTAAWLFPLYLFAINLFVLPIAFGGLLLFSHNGVDPDTFVLTLPMAADQELLALFVFLGGLSAATGMVIVATIALSTMVCNDLVMPVLLRLRIFRLSVRKDISGLLLGIRRGTIVMLLLLSYLYFRLIGESYALVTIGLVSFVAAAQFAPAILFGIYWRNATRMGAIAGLLAGFAVWGYTLLLPAFSRSGWLPLSFIEEGLFGWELLRPYQLFGLEGLSHIPHAVLWSLLANVGCLVGVSLFTRQGPIERVQAALFVDVFHTTVKQDEAHFWHGTATVGELHALVARFLGEERAYQALAIHASGLEIEVAADPRLVNRVERLLAGAIGAASARVMVSSTVKGEVLSVEGVMRILDETSQVMEYSRRLEQKSTELEAATSELRAVNRRLQELDRLKDDFLSMVSHELRTPLTSIRAFSEILRDNLDMPKEQRHDFLEIVVKETERLTRLINQVLDLAKIESRRIDWSPERLDLREVISDSMAAVSQLFHERGVRLEHRLPSQAAFADVDRDRITQVVINLLSNAGKFCEPGAGEVIVYLDQVPGGYRVSVQDNGPGIPPAHLGRIFEKFYQVTDEQKGKPKGTGLGLAVCERIIHYHGGRIWANSTVGEGTTFAFIVPDQWKQPKRSEAVLT